MFNFSSCQESMAEVLFEEYQFNSVLHCNGESSGMDFCIIMVVSCYHSVVERCAVAEAELRNHLSVC